MKVAPEQPLTNIPVAVQILLILTSTRYFFILVVILGQSAFDGVLDY